MRHIAGILGVALAMGSIGSLEASYGPCGAVALVTAAGQVAAGSTISKDNSDNEDGDQDEEGSGVVDPVPQDDGSDGVDEGTGDA